jgi:hypothetical protein
VGKTVGGVTFDRVGSSTANSPYLQRTDSGQPWSQRKQRRGQMFRDDHGRRWFAVTELLSGAPSGMIEHQFQAPLIPPQKYLELSRDPERPYDLHIAYERWIADTETDREEWHKNGRLVARRTPGVTWTEGDPFPTAVLDVIGPEPTPLEPILAAQQGNPWVLGKTTTPDRRLVQFFEAPETERRAKHRGIDYSKLEALEEDVDPDADGTQNGRPSGAGGRRNHHKKGSPTPDAGAPA